MTTYRSIARSSSSRVDRRAPGRGLARAVVAVAAAGLAANSVVGSASLASASGSAPAPDALGPAVSLMDSTGSWAPAGLASIRPGVLTATAGGGACTANFVYTDAKRNVYLGQAAHCSGTGAATETDGCEAKSLPVGTKVAIPAAGVTGTMVYNSWLAMAKAKEADAAACAYNDLALIQLPAAAISKVNPTVPVYGGPVGLNTTGTRPGEAVFSYGNSPTRQGIAALSPKSGTSLGTTGQGWSHTVYTLTPGIPGDSGSAFLDSQGRALGALSTLSLAPVPLSNQVSDLARQLAYAEAHSAIEGLRIVAGTQAFQARAVPVLPFL